MKLRLNALRLEQRKDVPLYVFGVNGRIIHQFAAVDPAKRTADGVLVGYQRQRVARHIKEIYRYLSSPEALLPNAIVIALDERVAFEPLKGAVRTEWGTAGRITVPIPKIGEEKPGFIVDGQQRVSALADLEPDRDFPVVVVGFLADSIDLSREQFVLVNKTKPLPRDLLNELLPHVDAELPEAWRLRQVSASVLEVLRYDKNSPFYGRVRGVGGEGPGYNISQASVMSVVEGSIRQGGVLSDIYSEHEGTEGVGRMAKVLSVYFEGIRRVWPYAWSGSPWSSRLVHGVGIFGMGRLMDVVMTEVDADRPRAILSVQRRLEAIATRCAWTEGTWPVLDEPWDGLQNTAQDKRRLSAFLLEEYGRASRPPRGRAGGNRRRSTGRVGDQPPSSKRATKKESSQNTEFDQLPLGLLTVQIAELVEELGPLPQNELVARYQERNGVTVPRGRERVINKFAWSAKGRRLISEVGGAWVRGPASLERDQRWGDWTITALVLRAQQLLETDEDVFDELVAEVQSRRPGRVPRLIMSVVGTAVNQARRDSRTPS
jgi:DGQHR domain-containing protein